MRRIAHHLDRQLDGAFKQPPTMLRMSRIAAHLRRQGLEAAAVELEKEAKTCAPWCQKCERAIPDPIVGTVGQPPNARVAYGCPWCSSPDVLAKWEAEGREAALEAVKP